MFSRLTMSITLPGSTGSITAPSFELSSTSCGDNVKNEEFGSRKRLELNALLPGTYNCPVMLVWHELSFWSLTHRKSGYDFEILGSSTQRLWKEWINNTQDQDSCKLELKFISNKPSSAPRDSLTTEVSWSQHLETRIR